MPQVRWPPQVWAGQLVWQGATSGNPHRPCLSAWMVSAVYPLTVQQAGKSSKPSSAMAGQGQPEQGMLEVPQATGEHSWSSIQPARREITSSQCAQKAPFIVPSVRRVVGFARPLT